MKKISRYKNYILGIIGILFVLTIFVHVQYLMHPQYKELPEVKIKENGDKNNSFAIMIQENDGEDKYKEYEGNTWPGDNYKFKEAKCMDNNGSETKENVLFEDGKIVLATDKTVYCTLYFELSIIGKLRENDPNKVLSNEEIGGMYRYQGVGTDTAVDDTHKLVDNNYICFGTKDKAECLNDKEKYMYRIIGINKNGQMKLIKMTNVKDGDTSQFVWNNIYFKTDCGDDKCEWPTSLLYKRINGISNGSVSASGTLADGGNSDIFIDNPSYDYLKSGDNVNGGSTSSDWYNLISQYNWMYGYIIPYVNGNIDDTTVYGMLNNGNIVYQIETGQLPTLANGNSDVIKYQWTNYVPAKIGLMYLHDYFLAYDNNKYWYGYSSTSSVPTEDYNWLFTGNNNTIAQEEWMISTYGPNNDFGNSAWFVATHGNPTINDKALISTSTVRPVFYLTNNIKITGFGSENNPFLIKF